MFPFLQFLLKLRDVEGEKVKEDKENKGFCGFVFWPGLGVGVSVTG